MSLSIVDDILHTGKAVLGVGNKDNRVLDHMRNEREVCLIRSKGGIAGQRLGVEARRGRSQRILITGPLGGEIGITDNAGTAGLVHGNDVHRAKIILLNDLNDLANHNVIAAAGAKGNHELNVFGGDPTLRSLVLLLLVAVVRCGGSFLLTAGDKCQRHHGSKDQCKCSFHSVCFLSHFLSCFIFYINRNVLFIS